MKMLESARNFPIKVAKLLAPLTIVVFLLLHLTLPGRGGKSFLARFLALSFA
jgi:hypothetical protein